MNRRDQRITIDHPVELYASGRRHVATLADVSNGGVFVRGVPSLPPQTEIRLALVVDGVRHVTAARVAHARPAGVGVAFRRASSAHDEAFARALGGLARRFAKGTGELPIVSSTLANTLSSLIELAPYESPTYLPAELEAPDHPAVATVDDDIPIEIEAEATAPIAHEAPRVQLKGTFPLPAVLAMLEQERASGRLAILPDAWIDLVDGRITGAGTSADPELGMPLVMAILDRPRVTFDFRARVRLDTVPGMGVRGVAITHALMEHARVTDERRR